MSDKYVLAPVAESDLFEILDYIEHNTSAEAADRTEDTILSKLSFLADSPGAGHIREDLTGRADIRFFSVFSYLIVYRAQTRPLQVVSILHGHRDVQNILNERI